MNNPMTVQCFQAFKQIRRNNGGHVEDFSLSQHDDTSIRVEDGNKSQSLKSSEVEELCRFLQEVQIDRTSSTESLQSSLNERLVQFRFEETSLSGQNAERIGMPGGPVHALLGLILHVQSEDDVIDAFWDPRSATINMFKEKGIDENFVFGYDWHWGAQGALKRKQGCPASKMSRELVDLHDRMSTDLIDILSPPFLLTASACAREGVRKTFSEDARSLEIHLGYGCGSIQLDLDFRKGRLRHFIIHVHHPVAGFYTSRKERPCAAARIDASINLILWLLGRPHDPLAFFKRYSSRPPRLVWHAPLQEMWNHNSIENSTGKPLGLEEFTPTFFGWAGRYLAQDPASIISEGGSLIAIITSIIQSRMSLTSKKSWANKKWRSDEKQRKDKEEQQRVDEKQRKDKEKQQRVDEKQPPAVASGPKRKREPQSVSKANDPRVTRSETLPETRTSPRIERDTVGPINLKVNHLSDDHLPKILSSEQSLKNKDQQSEERTGNILKMASWSLTESPDSYLSAGDTRKFALDSIPVPIPMDDLCSESIELKHFVTVQDTINANLVRLRSLEGTPVTCDLTGRLMLINAPSDLDLQLRLSRPHAAKLNEARGGWTVHFLPHVLQIRNGDNILYEKPYERVLSSKWAPYWLLQLTYEQSVLRQRRPELFTDETVGPQRALRIETGHFRNGELKRKLSEGSYLTCHREKKPDGTVYGFRVGFRGISTCIPFSADPEKVFVQAVLVKEGMVHPHPLASSAQPGDPAQRLGIWIRYQTLTSKIPIQYWATTKGDASACKANSLVDFLEDRPLDYTEDQDRRWLGNRYSVGRMKPCYSSK